MQGDDEQSAALGPTPERLAMAGDSIEFMEAAKNEHWRAIRMLDNHVLEFLYSRASLTISQYNAGIQFYEDWYNSGQANSGVIDPGRIVVDGGQVDHMTDRNLDAQQYFKRAVQAVGMVHSTVLTDVVLLEMTLEDWGRKYHGYKNAKDAKKAGKISLVNALTQLDFHYHGQRRKNPSRTCHEPDYRPEISPQSVEASMDSS